MKNHAKNIKMKKISAIVYTTNTGYTKKYAELLSKHTGLPLYSLKDATKLSKGEPIIYLGWLMAGVIKGYKRASKSFTVSAVCGVGMGESGSQIKDIRKNNTIPEELPVFTLQGGFDIKKLHGIYKFMMTVMAKTAGKGLADKQNRTSDEDKMLKMLLDGGDFVSLENLAPVLEWYSNDER